MRILRSKALKIVEEINEKQVHQKKQNRKDGIKVDIQSKYTKQALENL